MSSAPPLVAIVGATATGKSELAAALAQRLHGEVLSCDASCVYRGLDIGTAKPSGALLRRVPHHLIDVCEPDEDFTAAHWLELAKAKIRELEASSLRPIVAGGTGLYLRLLLTGLAHSEAADHELRRRLETMEDRCPGRLHRILRRWDPEQAGRVSEGDRFRLVRALEHRLTTGRRASEDRRQWEAGDSRPAVRIGLRLERAARELRIRDRIARMLDEGWLDEVRGLLDRGIDPGARSLRAIGYRELVLHLDGVLSLDEAAERIAVATRQYAKRQDTWFRREPGIHWFEAAEDPAALPGLVERVMMTRTLHECGPRSDRPGPERSAGCPGEEVPP